MRVIIAGCGRTGAHLASLLDAEGADVVIIDKDESAFRRLREHFKGEALVGVVFDKQTLMEAGIEHADAFVAVTSGDNSNVVSARIAHERFRVPTVVARIYDPARAEIYERYGLTTIAAAHWTVDAIHRHLSPADHRIDNAIGPGAGDVVILSHDLPADIAPREVATFDRDGAWHVTAVTRTGRTTLPTRRELVQGRDRIHLAVQREALTEAEAFLKEGIR